MPGRGRPHAVLLSAQSAAGSVALSTAVNDGSSLESWSSHWLINRRNQRHRIKGTFTLFTPNKGHEVDRAGITPFRSIPALQPALTASPQGIWLAPQITIALGPAPLHRPTRRRRT